jgi:hypothetical protein
MKESKLIRQFKSINKRWIEKEAEQKQIIYNAFIYLVPGFIGTVTMGTHVYNEISFDKTKTYYARIAIDFILEWEDRGGHKQKGKKDIDFYLKEKSVIEINHYGTSGITPDSKSYLFYLQLLGNLSALILKDVSSFDTLRKDLEKFYFENIKPLEDKSYDMRKLPEILEYIDKINRKE